MVMTTMAFDSLNRLQLLRQLRDFLQAGESEISLNPEPEHLTMQVLEALERGAFCPDSSTVEMDCHIGGARQEIDVACILNAPS